MEPIILSPKEKAEELYNKIYSILVATEAFYVEDFSKHFALIAIDEIIKAGEQPIVIEYFNDRYWQEVKQEIEKL